MEGGGNWLPVRPPDPWAPPVVTGGDQPVSPQAGGAALGCQARSTEDGIPPGMGVSRRVHSWDLYNRYLQEELRACPGGSVCAKAGAQGAPGPAFGVAAI